MLVVSEPLELVSAICPSAYLWEGAFCKFLTNCELNRPIEHYNQQDPKPPGSCPLFLLALYTLGVSHSHAPQEHILGGVHRFFANRGLSNLEKFLKHESDFVCYLTKFPGVAIAVASCTCFELSK